MTAWRRASLAFFAGTWALLAGFRAHAPLHLDTARDLLIARDCVLGGACAGAGPRSSFGGLMQGALWSHLLELREHLGLGLVALERAADLLLAVAAALVPLVARRIDAPANALTWALWFPATLLTIGYPQLWNPTPWPLALVLTFLALLHAARTGGALAFGMAAGALALAVDVHVATGVMVPLAVFVAVACARRPAVALPLAAVMFVGVLALDSPGAFAENRARLGPYTPAIAGGLVMTIVAGARARRRTLAYPAVARARGAAVAACAYGVTVMALLSLWTGHGLDPRYFAPIVTPAAIVLSGWIDPRLPRMRGVASARLRAGSAALVVVAHIALWVAQQRIDRQLRLIEVEAIAGELYGRGLAFGDLYRHVRGPRAFHLVSVLAALEPPDRRAHGGLARDLLVLRVHESELPREPPADWTVVDLGAFAAVVVAYVPEVSVDRIEVCRDDCEAVTVDVERFAQGEGMSWTTRAYAGLAGLARRFAGAERVAYRLPRRAAPSRQLVLFHDDCGRWTIADDGRDGVVTFSVTPRSRCRGWLPPFAEIDARDSTLAAMVAAAGGASPP